MIHGYENTKFRSRIRTNHLGGLTKLATPLHHLHHFYLSLSSRPSTLALRKTLPIQQYKRKMDLESTILFEIYDSVCGCPELWDSASGCPRHTTRSKNSTIAHGPPAPCSPLDRRLHSPHCRQTLPAKPPTPPSTPPDQSLFRLDAVSPPAQPERESGTDPISFLSSLLATPATQTRGLPRETCFFWYHGDCRLGDSCIKAHEHHITWPIAIPPGLVHHKPCKLTFCPLRETYRVSQSSDLNIKQKQKAEDANEPASSAVVAPLSKIAYNSPTSSPVPEKEIETCFFWYHGKCRRGKRCTLAHEVVSGEMVKAPLKYDGSRHGGCARVLCPFRNVQEETTE